MIDSETRVAHTGNHQASLSMAKVLITNDPDGQLIQPDHSLLSHLKYGNQRSGQKMVDQAKARKNYTVFMNSSSHQREQEKPLLTNGPKDEDLGNTAKHSMVLSNRTSNQLNQTTNVLFSKESVSIDRIVNP